MRKYLTVLTAMGLLLAAIGSLKKRINRRFTLWRLRPARLALSDEFGHGRINSKQIHSIDAEMLRKCKFSYCLVAAIMLAAIGTARADVQLQPAVQILPPQQAPEADWLAQNTTPTTPAPVPSLELTNIVALSGNTNWCVAPYGIYRMDNHKFGYGAAGLYNAAQYLWVGARIETVGGIKTTAGVQAQLQATVTWNGIAFTPFAETSTGMGSSALYASAGSGLYVSFHTWHVSLFGHGSELEIGAVGAYEHVVASNNQQWNQIDAGPLGRLSF
jgi:hypothetical protein